MYSAIKLFIRSELDQSWEIVIPSLRSARYGLSNCLIDINLIGGRREVGATLHLSCYFVICLRNLVLQLESRITIYDLMFLCTIS